MNRDMLGMIMATRGVSSLSEDTFYIYTISPACTLDTLHTHTHIHESVVYAPSLLPLLAAEPSSHLTTTQTT